MGVYEEQLIKYMNSSDFVRVFHGICPDCGKRVWNVGERFDSEKHRIIAQFVCNCGAKFDKTVFSKAKGYKYRYPQGIVEYTKSTTIPCDKIIKQNNFIYKVTTNGVKKKPIKRESLNITLK